MSPLQGTFFGLGGENGDKYLKSVYDEIFDLKYYGSFSIFESFNLPLGLRKYYVDRLIQKLEEEQKALEKAKKKSSRKE